VTTTTFDPQWHIPGPDERLEGGAFVVTGASRGIGRAIALDLARRGASVVLVAKKRAGLEAVLDIIEGFGGQAVAVDVDLGDHEKLVAVADAIGQLHPQINGLVNAAAALGPMTALEWTDLANWRRVIDVNLTGTFAMTRVLMPLLRKAPWASIVNLSAAQGRQGRAWWGAYSAAKFGVESLTQTWAQELEKTEVRINAVDPGPTQTDMRQRAYPGEMPDRNPPPEQILPIFRFLLSPASRGVTGRALNARDFMPE